MITLGTVRRTMFGVSRKTERAVFAQPGFAPEAWDRFNPVVRSLLDGYHMTLEDSRYDTLVKRLDAINPALHGFAYEGAAMGLAALDIVAPWRHRVNEFVDGYARAHIYPIYVGVGLALARLRRQPEPYLKHLDPMLSWVIVDGYGFHEGFFARKRYVQQRAIPTHLSPYAQRLFDQGLGRSIWFSSGGNIAMVQATVGSFQPPRQIDIWSGVGLACAYGGGVERAALEALRDAVVPYRVQLARGAAVAAWGRKTAGNLVPHTDLACRVFGGVSAEEAADTAYVASHNISSSADQPAHEIWRQRTLAKFADLV